jgi:hypothetical protein
MSLNGTGEEYMVWGNAAPLTSPNSRSILKLRLLILSCGDPGKHTMQFVNEYTTSRKYEPSDAIVLELCGLTAELLLVRAIDSYPELTRVES